MRARLKVMKTTSGNTKLSQTELNKMKGEGGWRLEEDKTVLSDG